MSFENKYKLISTPLIGGIAENTLLLHNQGIIPFYNILETVPGNIFWRDLQGRYLGCNKKVLELAGLQSLEDILGLTDFDLPWANLAPKLRKHDEKVIRLKKAVTLSETIMFGGKTRHYLTTYAPLWDINREIIGVIGTSIDITQQVLAKKKVKLAQKKEKKALAVKKLEQEFREAMVILAGSIAHDLKTPLSSLLLYSDLIANTIAAQINLEISQDKKSIAQDLQEALNSIQSFNGKINKNIHDMDIFINSTMTAISNLLTNSLTKKDFVYCEIVSCIEDVVSHYPFTPNQKELIHLDLEHNFRFLGNPVLVYRVLANLINNALRQIHLKKQGQIYITTDVTDLYNVVKIKDTAGGIKAGIVKNIFSTDKDKSFQNTGIGLKFSKITMQSFGGDITCHLVDDEHIEFILYFAKL